VEFLKFEKQRGGAVIQSRRLTRANVSIFLSNPQVLNCCF